MMAHVARMLALIWVVSASCAWAHEIRPAYLQIEEIAPHRYDVLWKVPSNNGRVLDIQPQFDEALRLEKSGDEMVLGGFVVYRYGLTGDKGLQGMQLVIRNLRQTTVDVLANLTMLDGSRYTFLLQPTNDAIKVPLTPSAWNVVSTYTKLGIEHILFGFDHLLFVTSLMLIVRRWQTLLKTITAFTVAHSLTLALATFGLVTLPSGPVEAMIALSIVLVCVEAVRLRRGETSLAIQWPWLVAFAFGLLHGFGFAGALAEIGMPQVDVPLALLFFNVGVELGQLAFIAVIVAITGAIGRLLAIPPRMQIAATYLIGSIASFWVFERLDAMFL